MATNKKAAQAAVTRYKQKNYDRVLVLMPKGERDRLKAYAKSQGQSVNALILDLLNREMLGFEYEPEETDDLEEDES
ncbi:MAG: hypothetical protein J6S92_06485 [Oscillospiraceae bacterium]|nr:hypothetical protein [Oscillospiraceae bacterium]